MWGVCVAGALHSIQDLWSDLLAFLRNLCHWNPLKMRHSGPFIERTFWPPSSVLNLNLPLRRRFNFEEVPMFMQMLNARLRAAIWSWWCPWHTSSLRNDVIIFEHLQHTYSSARKQSLLQYSGIPGIPQFLNHLLGGGSLNRYIESAQAFTRTSLNLQQVYDAC